MRRGWGAGSAPGERPEIEPCAARRVQLPRCGLHKPRGIHSPAGSRGHTPRAYCSAGHSAGCGPLNGPTMEVTLRFLETRDDALTLSSDIDHYAREATAEFRDELVADGIGVRLVRDHFDSPHCVFLTATEARSEERIGLCVTVPFVDPLVGDSMAMVVVLSVHPDFRHRGLAGRMISALHEELGSRGVHTLAARAGHNDDALISMGERWGFVRLYEVMVHERE